MRISFPLPECTPSDVVQVAPAKIRVRQLMTHSGSQWFHWAARIDDLREGETLEIELEWPRVPLPDELKGASQEVIWRFTKQGSFVDVLPKVMGMTEDFETWTFPPVTVKDNFANITIQGSGRPVHVTTQYPYGPGHLERLFDFLKEKEPESVLELGCSRGGLPIRAAKLESRNPAAPIVYVQAFQHMTEYTGPWVADRMIRWLTGTLEGNALRQKFAFHIVPAVDVDGLTHGLLWQKAVTHETTNVRKKNINREWETGDYPEVGVIDRFIQAQLAAGRRYCLGFDFHNGWIDASDSGACYTAFPETMISPTELATQKRFADHLYNNTDHEPAGRYWIHDAPGTFAQHFRKLTGVLLSHTVEFSRSIWWNRTSREWEAYRPEHHDRYAREVLTALGSWEFSS